MSTQNDDIILSKAQAILARREAAKAKEKATLNAGKLGTCYRYRNSYSCPEDPSDYWWLYVRVDSVGEGGDMRGLHCQIDKNGHIDIKPDWWIHLNDGYQPISRDEFDQVLLELRIKIAKLTHP